MRLGVGASWGMLFWGQDDTPLWTPRQPDFLAGFFHYGFGRSSGRKEGGNDLRMPALVLRNDQGSEWCLGYAQVEYSRSGSRYDVESYQSRYHHLRLEYTRSTRPHSMPQRPRIGFRYGCALFGRVGVTDGRIYGGFPSGQYFSSTTHVGARTLVLQPTVQFGYRSRWLNAGLQMYWNLLAFTTGKVDIINRDRYSLEVIETYRAVRFDELVFVDRLAQWRLFGSNIQLFMSVPIVRVHVPKKGER